MRARSQPQPYIHTSIELTGGSMSGIISIVGGASSTGFTGGFGRCWVTTGAAAAATAAMMARRGRRRRRMAVCPLLWCGVWSGRLSAVGYGSRTEQRTTSVRRASGPGWLSPACVESVR